uniref:Uncharacterized protein n=1 Tax=Pararge aegeria TaxID=116150 RepID=S4P368_9NEOP
MCRWSYFCVCRLRQIFCRIMNSNTQIYRLVQFILAKRVVNHGCDQRTYCQTLMYVRLNVKRRRLNMAYFCWKHQSPISTQGI